ncbi:glutamine-tRNA ligase [Perilla frutescens var. frutescens]|nr:glutamine-tRNA ligase [Perilla frutescens var. frutescens]
MPIEDDNGCVWYKRRKQLLKRQLQKNQLKKKSIHLQYFRHQIRTLSDRPVLRPCNSKEILDKHLKVTGGGVYTRFPSEPNGYLHIGHAKAVFVDFGLAKERGGCCYLRYDDTNPEAGKKEYIDHIEEIVGWMGWEPFKV